VTFSEWAAHHFGAEVRARRLATGHSQRWLANQLGLHREIVSRTERGDHVPSLETVERYARVFGCTALDMLRWIDSAPVRGAA